MFAHHYSASYHFKPIWLTFFCRTQNETFSTMFTLLSSRQWSEWGLELLSMHRYKLYNRFDPLFMATGLCILFPRRLVICWKTSTCANVLKAKVAKHKWSDSARFALHLSIHHQTHRKTRQQYQQPIKKLLVDISSLQQSFTNLLSYIKPRGECDYVTIKQHNKDTLFISGSRDSRRVKSHNHRFNNECGR